MGAGVLAAVTPRAEAASMEKSEEVLQGATGRDGPVQTEGGPPPQGVPRARLVQVGPWGGPLRRLQIEGRLGGAYPRALLQATEMRNTGVPTELLARLRFRGVGVPARLPLGPRLPATVTPAARDDAVKPTTAGGVVLARRMAAAHAATTSVVMAPVTETVPGAAGVASALPSAMAVAGALVARAVPEIVAVAAHLTVLSSLPAAAPVQVASAEVPARVAARLPTRATSPPGHEAVAFQAGKAIGHPAHDLIAMVAMANPFPREERSRPWLVQAITDVEPSPIGRASGVLVGATVAPADEAGRGRRQAVQAKVVVGKGVGAAACAPGSIPETAAAIHVVHGAVAIPTAPGPPLP